MRIGYLSSSISTESRNMRPFVTAFPYVTQPSCSGPAGPPWEPRNFWFT
jgi:hypothetical protein